MPSSGANAVSDVVQTWQLHIGVAELVKRPVVKTGSYGGSNPSPDARRAVGVG